MEYNLKKGRIVLIDDEQVLRFTLGSLLEDEDYEVFFAENGKKGIEVIQEQRPELILLDVNMPVMDGFETLEFLKNQPDLDEIPVIMNTAKNDEKDQVRAFELGAVDFIPKPHRELELLARIETHINQFRLKKMREQFLLGLNHDLKSPLSIIIGMNEALKMNAIEGKKKQQICDSISVASKKMLSLIHNFLDIGKLQSGGMSIKYEVMDICRIYNQEIVFAMHNIKQKQLKINYLTKCTLVDLDANLIKRCLANLISNAIKFTPEQGTIQAELTHNEKEMIFSLWNSGDSIPEQQRKHIFEMYYQVGRGHKKGEGTGLGLSIVQEIIYAHHGKIWIDPDTKEGCCFKFSLPLQKR